LIVGLIGEVIKKEPTLLYLQVGGVIYEIFISLNTSSAIEKKEIKIHTTHIIREDDEKLYGFATKAEKEMFDRLIRLNGVGPKVALAICSTFTPQKFVEVVQNKDISMLKKVPGIGPKSAKRILVELGEFSLQEQIPQNSAFLEAQMALESLGFKKEQALKALEGCSASDTAGLIKEALRKIQKI